MGIEVLIHNVGHHDLWALRGDDAARPSKVRNVKVHSFAKRVEAHLDAGGTWTQRAHHADGVMALAPRLRLRSKDAYFERSDDDARDGSSELVGVCIPLLPAALKAWEARCAPGSERALVLLHSGYDESVRELSGPSTESTARLLARWAEAHAQGLSVTTLRSTGGDLFRYAHDAADHDALVNHLASLRARAAEVAEQGAAEADASTTPKEDWRAHLTVTLSASTGTDAVRWSLAALVLPYRPRVLHITAPRSAPSLVALHEVDEVDERAVRAASPRSRDSLPPDLRVLCDEMAKWRDDFRRARGEGNELEKFWQRKSKKPVLAVLLVRRPEGALGVHRGCNLEVSMPTGSLCAERNAIGTALAADPRLARRDVVGVAVFAPDGPNPLDPCGACSEWLAKIAEVSPAFRVLTFADASFDSIFVRHTM